MILWVYVNRSTSMVLLRYQKPVDGVPDPGRSLSSSIPAQARDRESELLKAVGTADRDRRVKSFEVSSRWQFPLYQWYGMGIPSLALIRGSSFSPMARHGIRSRDRERARVRVNKIFAWFNFRRCAWATKIKQREKLKGEVYLTRKFPDLRYCQCCEHLEFILPPSKYLSSAVMLNHENRT